MIMTELALREVGNDDDGQRHHQLAMLGFAGREISACMNLLNSAGMECLSICYLGFPSIDEGFCEHFGLGSGY